MDVLAGIAGFTLGCIIWNYFGPIIKGWLHIGERAAGELIATDAAKLKADAYAKAKSVEADIKSKL